MPIENCGRLVFLLGVAPSELPEDFRWGAIDTSPIGNRRWVIGPDWDALVPEGDASLLMPSAEWLEFAESHAEWVLKCEDEATRDYLEEGDDEEI